MRKLLFFLFIFLLIVIIFKRNEVKNNEELRGIYISYIEISKYLCDKDEITSKNNIKKMISNVKDFNCNTIILQVRPSADAIYYSKLFPISKYLSSSNTYSYDVLDFFIKESHKNSIKVFAWINPYRVSTSSDINAIDSNSPAYKYINTDTLYISNGIYFNPSKDEVVELIVEGVKEIVDYDIDGVLFDDYFYPSNDIDVDDYKSKNLNISIEEYHLNVVNDLIKKVHSVCIKKNKVFGVAPDGNIENNYNKNYADVKKWMKSNIYIDYISPQLYYGFYNSSKPFTSTLNEWSNLNSSVDLYISLAFYKVGLFDVYAKDGNNEWIENNNIIMKEILYSRNISNYKGFMLYRYDNIFDENIYNGNSKFEINNVKKILK